MIDLTKEAPIDLPDVPKVVAELYAPNGRTQPKPFQFRTVRNWVTRGISGVVLETISIGGRIATSREALIRFFNGISEARAERLESQRDEVESYRAVHRRTKAALAARQRLAEKHGI